jgi:uncharacterized protein
MRKSRLLPRLFLVLFLFELLLFSPQAGADDKAFIWKVKSGASTAYVLGSIHAAKEDLYPLNAKIERAFQESTAAAFEIDLNIDLTATISSLMSSAMYKPDDSLKNHMTSPGYELASAELRKAGLDTLIIDRCKPWILAMLLETLELAKIGYRPELGIDTYFYNKAGNKKVSALETAEYQISLFGQFSDREQEAFLLATLKELKQLKTEMASIVNLWKNGDADKMDAAFSGSVSKSPELAGVFEKILYKRNRNMARKIEDYLRSGETYFVVAGAAHLIGKNGIIEILRGMGYSVEQL